MKLVVSLLAVSFIVAAGIVGCGGSPSLTCQSATCSSGARTYQVCSNVDGSVTYNFGGMSCSCSGNNCTSCSMEVANYCVGGAGGTGGTGGGGAGGGGGGGGVTCTATFSGGFSASYSPCAVAITYSASSNSTAIATAGNALPGTSYTWTGFSMDVAGMPATGTIDQTATMGASNEVTQQGSQNPPVWEAGYGSGNTFGSASIAITSLGPSMDLGNGNLLYQSPHGTWTGTLVDQNPMTAMPSVMETVTF
jgi:hypothetical protein